MDARKTLLVVFTSVLLFIHYRISPLCNHINNPSPSLQNFNNPPEALKIYKFNEENPDSSDEDTIPENADIYCQLENSVWPLLYEENVVTLTQKNFSDFITKKKNVMVMFYAPWCCWSRKLAPEYAAAAKMLKGEAAFGMVDCVEEVEFARKNNIHAYPVMYLFVDGVQQISYDELGRSRDAITSWVKTKTAVDVCNITTKDEAIYILNVESELVLAFLDSLEGPESRELAAASRWSHMGFYVAELFNTNQSIKRPALIMLQTVSKSFYIFSGQFTRFAISTFLCRINHSPVIIIPTGNARQIFQNPMKQLWLFAPYNGSDNVISTFEQAAAYFRGKLLFVYVDNYSEGVGNQIAHEFGITGDFLRITAYAEHDAEKPELNGELTLRSIQSFGKDFLEDRLSSQSVPASE